MSSSCVRIRALGARTQARPAVARPAVVVAVSRPPLGRSSTQHMPVLLRPGGSVKELMQPTKRPLPAPLRATASGDVSADGEAAQPGWKIPAYIVMWYVFNIVFNIVNKSALNAFPMPWFISTLQLGASAAFMVFLWVTRLQPVPKVDKGLFLALLPVGLFHTIGHVSACVSFSQMSVSFTHIVKAAEPVLSVALSGPLLGATYPLYVWASLLPIVAGCSLSAMKEVSFVWGGFQNAMISNLGMVLRNIYSKKSLVDYKHIDGINLFGLISIVSLVYCAPAAVIIEGSKWPAAWDAAVASLGQLPFLQLLATGGLFYHLYNQASYMVLDQGISPVTFSVGNTMKRVAVVVSSIMFFKNPVSPLNYAGSAIAIFGTYLYTVATDKQAEEKRAAAAAAAGTKPA
ncbi:hypothetical protein FOA52_012916 [Chlamydomonas sp. UWO 241]|nr:hypothetical protein FOA52_012916 [Chlamydomonas sp. UWO 241]